MQIDPAELPLASFSFVLTLYGKNSSGRSSNTVLCTIAFQEPSDSAHGELSSGIKTLLFSLKTFCGKLGENSRLDIATYKSNEKNNGRGWGCIGDVSSLVPKPHPIAR